MKQVLMMMAGAVFLAGCFGSPEPAQAAAPCAAPEPGALRDTWQAFRSAALAGQPAQIAAYYVFPVKLLSPMDGEQPLSISRPVFLKNYEALFRNGPADSEVGLYTELKASSGNETMPSVRFDTALCRPVGQVRVRDYNFVYDKKAGWKINAVYYGGDYPTAVWAGLDRLEQ